MNEAEVDASVVDFNTVERYWSTFRRYLPLLKLLEAKKYGWVIVQIHGKEPKRVGYLPALEAVGNGDKGEAQI
jgi:hypothetical protein